MNETNKHGNGFAVASALLFVFTAWFAFLGNYIHRATVNYKPLPNEVQEGDMVSAYLMLLLFACAAFCLVASLVSLAIYILKRHSESV